MAGGSEAEMPLAACKDDMDLTTFSQYIVMDLKTGDDEDDRDEVDDNDEDEDVIASIDDHVMKVLDMEMYPTEPSLDELESKFCGSSTEPEFVPEVWADSFGEECEDDRSEGGRAYACVPCPPEPCRGCNDPSCHPEMYSAETRRFGTCAAGGCYHPCEYSRLRDDCERCALCNLDRATNSLAGSR